MQDGGRCKMAAAAILDFQFMWIWPLRGVDSMVFVFCAKFGSNMCYSHWDRRTHLSSDFHAMTSRELTSGFDFWSRGHLCMAVMHLPMKFGADIFIQSGVIDIFPKLKMVAAPSWICLGEPWDHPRSLICGAYTSCKNFVMIGWVVIRIWIISRSGLKVLFTPPKFQFLGAFIPKI